MIAQATRTEETLELHEEDIPCIEQSRAIHQAQVLSRFHGCVTYAMCNKCVDWIREWMAQTGEAVICECCGKYFYRFEELITGIEPL